MLRQHFPLAWYVLVSTSGQPRAFQELKLSKAVAIQGFTLFEAGALVGTLLWAGFSDLANYGRRGLVACIALALIIATSVVSTCQ